MTSTGIVSINMKSGTNAVHGRAFADYTNENFSARPSYQPSVPPYTQARGGISAGGPFIKNKLFWFGRWEKTAYEDTRQNIVTGQHGLASRFDIFDPDGFFSGLGAD